MKFFKKGSAILIAGIILLSCTACSGLDKLADGLKSGVEQVRSNVAIGKSNALITPYQSFDGKRISDEMYAKDTSRKIKSALRTRRLQGKYMAVTAPFGYRKDENDHNHLVIDEVTASYTSTYT